MTPTANISAATTTLKEQVGSRPIRVAIICDFAEEQWPSMDLVGNMLHQTLNSRFVDSLDATLIRPALPFASTTKLSRIFGRFLHYPRELRRIRHHFDVFHIVDHSYAHLAHHLPAERTIVTCHDIDAFRCLLGPEAGRSFAFRAVSRRVLSGLQRATHVTCDTEATRQDVLAHNLLAADRITVVYNGVHPALRPEPNHPADIELTRLLGRTPGSGTDLLHVGSTIPRKRIDTLLNVFANLRQQRADLRLIRVGGAFTAKQRDVAQSLGILQHIDVLPRINEHILAAVYRRAALVLQTSQAEGFGLPVIEAMACGTPVIATDIPPLREVGGSVAAYCAVGDTDQFTDTLLDLLDERDHNHSAWQKRCANSLVQASRFTWTAYADKMAEIYTRISSQ
jgi:glycosyltransferase involved in cell wall biosynthesis